MASRKAGKNRHSSVSIFSSRVKCGCCGSWYGPKVWHSNDKYRRVIWQCNHKFEGEKCTTPALTEDQLKGIFLRAANQVIDAKDGIIAVYHEVLEPHLATDDLQQELDGLDAEINVVAGLIEDCIKENAHVALDQADYQKRYDTLVDRFDTAKARQKVLAQQITDRKARRQQILACSQLDALICAICRDQGRSYRTSNNNIILQQKSKESIIYFWLYYIVLLR